jgi:hypothetical protein
MREQINNMLDFWYENLTYQQLQKIYGQDNIGNDIKDLWYEMSIDDKLSIHEGVY